MVAKLAFGCLRQAVISVFSLVAPPRCRFCRAPLFDHSNPFLCKNCVSALDWIDNRACRGCGYPAGLHAVHVDHCQRCRGQKLGLTAAAAVVRYRAGARSLVLSLKFRGETEIARPMADLMAGRLREVDFGKIDLVLPVALHAARKRNRGFDQAGWLAKRIADLSGLTMNSKLLWRTRHTMPQATLRREARLANMAGAFAASSDVAGTSVLLIDDVMTTGATMAECAKACRAAGARRVYALVFAR